MTGIGVAVGLKGTRQRSSSVRRQIVSRLPVAAVATKTGACQATLFRWKRQALIDVGVIEGIPSVEADELAAAHKRIAAWMSPARGCTCAPWRACR